MEEEGGRKQEERGEGVGVEDEDEVAHAVGHGGFAHDHEADLRALRHHHPGDRRGESRPHLAVAPPATSAEEDCTWKNACVESGARSVLALAFD